MTARQVLYITFGKRLFDMFAALLLLALTLPMFALIACAIVLDDPGGAVYVQERAGRDHLPFRIYKFRTMRANTPSVSTEELARLNLTPYTRLGRFLRRSSLDELPQLLNVLRGDMSFVGPRPALLSQGRVLRLREQTGASSLRPGLTGFAQVEGRDDLDDVTKVLKDTRYLYSVSWRTDLLLLARTLAAVRGGRGTK